MSIAENINKLKTKLPSNVNFVAVSKTKPVSAIVEAYNGGQRVFGENKAQELANKHEELKDLDIEWHFIGHLQRNKVKYISSFVDLIHGVESIKLLQEIDKQAEKNNRVINCLLQFHIAKEDTKFGLSFDEANELLSSEGFKSLRNVQICGVMGMATYTDQKKMIAREFQELNTIFAKLRENHFVNQSEFKEISMGMSNDWPLAVEQGSTIVRVGSIIFGERNYIK